MNAGNQYSDDARLKALLRESRPSPPLPPLFQENVWRRIEKQERREKPESASLSWLDALVRQLLRPRWALASLTVLILAGAVGGAANRSAELRHQAQVRYLGSVSPTIVH